MSFVKLGRPLECMPEAAENILTPVFSHKLKGQRKTRLVEPAGERQGRGSVEVKHGSERHPRLAVRA